MKTIRIFFLLWLAVFYACSSKNDSPGAVPTNLTIFFVNDVHGQIDNLSKVKHIIDNERETTNVIVASSGDLFSGNPVVDNYDPKGFPIIQLMNKIGFDIAVLGNHDFDYGPTVLKDRIEQSAFPWICANAKAKHTGIAQPNAFETISTGNIQVTFLGLIETNGSKTEIIPSSHPWRVKDYVFTPAQNIVGNFTNLKKEENADVLIVLTHLGHNGNDEHIGDFQLAQQNPFFDLIIGGHSHAIIDTTINDTPIFQSGAYLHFLGKIELKIKGKELQTSKFTLINLDDYAPYDSELQAFIDDYNDWPELYKEIGYSDEYHSKSATGCFYTNAIREYMGADVSFQNTGGIRATLAKGPILKREIYEISPFNNGTVLYQMTVQEIKNFLSDSGSGFYYSGIQIKKVNNAIEIRDEQGRKIPDDYVLKVGLNDYIPAVHSSFFPKNGEIQPLTAAETIIAYLESTTGSINYSNCYNYFRY